MFLSQNPSLLLCIFSQIKVFVSQDMEEPADQELEANTEAIKAPYSFRFCQEFNVKRTQGCNEILQCLSCGSTDMELRRCSTNLRRFCSKSLPHFVIQLLLGKTLFFGVNSLMSTSWSWEQIGDIGFREQLYSSAPVRTYVTLYIKTIYPRN